MGIFEKVCDGKSYTYLAKKHGIPERTINHKERKNEDEIKNQSQINF